MRKLLSLFFIITFPLLVIAQNTNYRAQGNYYSAKENFQKRDYRTAISYVEKSKQNLGGTNRELQYLHILCAYYLENFDLALKELETYFAIEENKIKRVDFDKSVDKLTNDETKELTKLIDPIYEKGEKKKDANKSQKLINDLNILLQENCKNLYTIDRDTSYVKRSLNFSEKKHTYSVPLFSLDINSGVLTVKERYLYEYSSSGKWWGWKSKKTKFESVCNFNVKELSNIWLDTEMDSHKIKNCVTIIISFNEEKYYTFSYEVIEATGESAHVQGEKRTNYLAESPTALITIEIPTSNQQIFEQIKQILFELARR
jgi:tetratricopeptide (TPR) repeat protein